MWGKIVGTVAIVIVLATGLILGAVFPAPSGIITLSILGGGLLILTLLSAITMWRHPYHQWGWLANFWNPNKLFGGAVLGDVANMVGVFAGMGATRLFAAEAWWWIGQEAAVLALVVGLSLLWRSFWERRYLIRKYGIMESSWREYMNRWTEEDRELLDSAEGSRVPGLANLVVGIATWASLMLVTDSKRSLVRASGMRVYWFVFALLCLLFFLLMIFALRKQLREYQRRDKVLLVVAALLLVAMVILAALFLWQLEELFPSTPAVSNAGAAVGIVGVIFWALAELWNWALITRQWRLNFPAISIPDYLSWQKSLWQVIAASVTIAYLAAGIAGKDKEIVFQVLFILGATWGIGGTITGICGALTKRYTEGRPQQQPAAAHQRGSVQGAARARRGSAGAGDGSIELVEL